MKYWDELRQDYFNEDGLVMVSPTTDSNNGLLYLSEAYVVKALRGELEAIDSETFSRTVLACMVRPGVLQRHAVIRVGRDMDPEGPDDYIGVVAASYYLHTRRGKDFTGSNMATLIDSFGVAMRAPLRGAIQELTHLPPWLRGALCTLLGWVKVRYNYNNLTPYEETNRSSWLGRQPSFRAHLQFAAGKRPSLLLRLAWCAAVLRSAFTGPDGGTDPWILSWLLIVTMDNKSWLCTLAARYWQRRLIKLYPGDMGQVFSIYFNAAHPIARYVPSRTALSL